MTENPLLKAPKRKRGRPKGSKNLATSDKKVNSLLKELVTLEKQRTKIRRKLAGIFSR